ncbi:sulfite exporter TauE/SafE family protein [Hoyosella altamirensis]|uniref:Probable membrane transporter protein n=1 Tax=Hoyosella altamirensis TaxID=616997 RepID=A0A839RU91_9ACTN|nr:sulfite exporter TauE/SafE family protein [Hoyosella altamirensis]MBB3039796.1 hypothetical protein [Hoyosella altamirensis]
MTAEMLAAVLIAVAIGAVLQRVSGTGVGLVVAPTLAVLLGPVQGILATNIITAMSGGLITLYVWKYVDWRRYAVLAPAAVLGAVPGALVVRAVPAAWLQISIGALVLLTLVITYLVRTLPHLEGPVTTGLAGTAGGFFNTTAGIAAPAMVVYALVSRWDQRAFAATMNPVFMTMGLVSFLVKVAFGATGPEGLPPWWTLLAVAATVVVATFGGGLVARRVSPGMARALALSLAGAGAVVAIFRGVLALAG